MANRTLFNSRPQALTDTVNQAGGAAYALPPKAALAQLATTGCLNQVYYASAQTQLNEVLELCFKVEPAFVAQTAIYAREQGGMKDMPALLTAWLASFGTEYFEQTFKRVIDNGRMLRNFVQIMRSGAVARQSLGTRPKRLVRQWLQRASDARLIGAMVGQQPSLADVIKMVHPKAADERRSALYGYLIGREVDAELLPQAIVDLQRFRADSRQPVPAVPFELLTAAELSTDHWCAIATQASWTQTRMNLNTFARHGVFESTAMQLMVAKRLRDPIAIRRARAMPYQLMAAWQATSGLPERIRDALRIAAELAVANVPALRGTVAVAVDVSASMGWPLTGYRRGASSAMRCVDVAGLMAAAILNRHPGALVLPFNDRVRPWSRVRGGVLPTAAALAAQLGGGTRIAAPLELLVRQGCAPDTLVVLSDNQSWIRCQSGSESEVARYWRQLQQANPQAKMVCVDLQPYSNTQIRSDARVLNVGGFSDEVFAVIADFSADRYGGDHWVQRIEEIRLDQETVSAAQ